MPACEVLSLSEVRIIFCWRCLRFLFSVFSLALSIVLVFTSLSLPWATHDSPSASLDWEDKDLSSGEAISSSVATTVSVSQPVFTISNETLSQAFSQGLRHSVP